MADLWGALRRGWASLAVILVVSLIIGGTISVLLPSIYEGTATLRLGIGEEQPGLLSQLSPLGQIGLPGIGGNEIDTDIGVLQSRSIAEEVVDSLKLQIRLLEPAIARDSLLELVSAPRAVTPGRYRFIRGASGARGSEASPGVAPGESFEVGDAVVALRPGVLAEGDEIVVEILSFDVAVDELRDDLAVARQRGTSSLVDIGYRTNDRLLAAAVPNAIAGAFLRHTISTSKRESSNRVAVLREQVADYEAQLRAAEEDLRIFRQNAQVVEPGTQVSEQIQRLAQIQAGRDAMHVEREALSRILARIQAGIAPGDSETSPYRQLASFPAFVGNQGVQEIVRSLITLENERAELLVRRTPASVDIQGIDTRIRELEQQLYDFAASYLRGLETQIASATEVVSGFGVELAAVPAVELEYQRRVREQALLTELYTYLQTRLQEAEIEEATELGNSRVLDSARVPRAPVSPKPMVNLALASILGLMVGAAVVIGRRLADPKVRTPADAELASGLPVLGVIPSEADLKGLRPSGRSSVARRVSSQYGNESTPASRVSEAYSSVGALMTPRGDKQSRLLLVSRISESEDSASVAANLAITLAEQGKRVLLVDADLRGGKLAAVLGVDDSPGLAQVLTGSAEISEAVREIEASGSAPELFFLPSGNVGGRRGHANGSQQIAELLLQLRSGFELVVVSAPPTTRLHELLDVGANVDAAVLAAHVGLTDKADLEQAVRQMHQLDLPLRGIVLRETTAGSSWSLHRIWLPNLRIHTGGRNGQPA